jgi:hypothetical protein
VAEHDGALEQGAIRRVHGAVRQGPESGGDAVDDLALAVETIDDLTRWAHPRPHPWIEGHGLALAGGAHHRIDA